MRHALILALGTALAFGTVAAVAQTPAKPAAAPAAGPKYDPTKPYPAYTAPKLAIGQPDLQGVWSNATLTPMTRARNVKSATFTEDEVKKMEQAVVDEVNEGNKRTDPNSGADYTPDKNLRPEFAAAGGAVGGYNRGWLDPGNQVMRVNGEPRSSLVTTPDGQAPARKAGAQAATQAQPAFYSLLGASPTPKGGSFENPESRGNGERCIISFGRNGGPPMFANGFYNNNYQIVQSPSAVMIEVEMNHDARIVRLNSKHRTDDVRPYFGDAIGWWEGDTLVVETTNIPQSQNFMGSWKNLKVTEKFKRVADDRLLYQFTVEDPDTWDKAWGGEYEFHPLEPARLFEYACHEGNYAMHGILSGARVQEAKAAAAAAEKAKADAAAQTKPGAKPAKPAAPAKTGQ
ncbi:MAG TPA: hypothetical protein VG942_18585 [Hyphomonadaceae bacterium]|nr:hypothetical protein [Hyphomonadaceae bacterium]